MKFRHIVDCRFRHIGHASHEACELKSTFSHISTLINQGHASHEACELKYGECTIDRINPFGHASHEACELKSYSVSELSARLWVTPRMRRVS